LPGRSEIRGSEAAVESPSTRARNNILSSTNRIDWSESQPIKNGKLPPTENALVKELHSRGVMVEFERELIGLEWTSRALVSAGKGVDSLLQLNPIEDPFTKQIDGP
jgi:hypothetical protein